MTPPKYVTNVITMLTKHCSAVLFVCPIAIAYSMRLSVCVCHCARLWALSLSHFLIDFHQNGIDVRTPKSKNECVGGQYRTTPSPIPPNKPILGQEVLKIYANIK